MKRQQITAFYLETLILIVVFIGIILVLVRVFGLGKEESESARLLTNAVSLSENAAEAFAASADPSELLQLLREKENVVLEPVEGSDQVQIEAFYDADRTPDPEGSLTLRIVWDPEEGAGGVLVSGTISVWYQDRPEPVYTLETAHFLRN